MTRVAIGQKLAPYLGCVVTIGLASPRTWSDTSLAVSRVLDMGQLHDPSHYIQSL